MILDISVMHFYIIFVNSFLATMILLNERKGICTSWGWIFLLFSIPILGLVIYVFFGRKFRGNIPQIPPSPWKDVPSVSTSLDRELLYKYANLIKMNLQSPDAFMTTDNEIAIFCDGKEKFHALLEDIRGAQKEINIQYYIIKRDILGTMLRNELIKKAQEGIKVRVLYDEVGSRRLPRSFFKELYAYGGEVEVLIPSFLKLINFNLNYRNHRKVCIIDGKTAFIGGFNIGKEYLGLNKKYGYWRDTHLKICGFAVNAIQRGFIVDWHHAKNEPIKNLDSFSFQTNKHIGSSPIQIITSGPNSKTENLKNMFIHLILSAKRSVFIQTPYFIPDQSFLDACKMALLAGVDLRIMIPNRDFKPFVYWATYSYAGELLSYGAKILLYENGFLHAKTIVVDQEVASVGSANIDIRSFKLNFEINAVVYDKKIASELGYIFLQDNQLSSELTLERYKTRPTVTKLKEGVSRLLSPIM